MADAATVTISVDANSAKLVLEMLKATRATQKATRQMQTQWASFQAATKSAVNGIVGSMRILAGVFAVRELVRYGEAWGEIQNRLRLVSATTEDVIATQERLFSVAQATRTGLEETVELYRRVNISSHQLNLTSVEQIDLIKTINQSLQISGATAQEARNGLIQFAQGLASSRLAGDELRAVLEQMPRLALAVADGLGVNIGVLREWGKQGKLTAQAVVAAIRSQAATIDEEFKNVIPTIQQTMTKIRNVIVTSVGPAVRLMFDTITKAFQDTQGFGGIVTSLGGAAIVTFTAVNNAIITAAAGLVKFKAAIISVRIEMMKLADDAASPTVLASQAAASLAARYDSASRSVEALRSRLESLTGKTSFTTDELLALRQAENQLRDVTAQVVELGRRTDSEAGGALQSLLELRAAAERANLSGPLTEAAEGARMLRDQLGSGEAFMSSAMATLNEAILEVRGSLTATQEEAARLWSRGELVPEETSQRVAELQERLRKLSDEKTRLSVEFTGLREAQADFVELTQSIATMRNEAQELGTQLSAAIKAGVPEGEMTAVQQRIAVVNKEISKLIERRDALSTSLAKGTDLIRPEQAAIFLTAAQSAADLANEVAKLKAELEAVGVDTSALSVIDAIDARIRSLTSTTLAQAASTGKVLLSPLGELEQKLSGLTVTADQMMRGIQTPEAMIVSLERLASAYGGLVKPSREFGTFTAEALAAAQSAGPRILALVQEQVRAKQNFELAADRATVDAIRAGRESAVTDLDALIMSHAASNAKRQRELDELTGRAREQSELEAQERVNEEKMKLTEQFLERDRQLREKFASEGDVALIVDDDGQAAMERLVAQRLEAKQRLVTGEQQLEEQAIALGIARVREQFAIAEGLDEAAIEAERERREQANEILRQMAAQQAYDEVMAKYEAQLAAAEALGIAIDPTAELEMRQEIADRTVEIIADGEQRATDATVAEITRRQQAMRNYESVRQQLARATFNNLLGLLQTLGQKNKAFAIAAIALEKGRAIAETVMWTAAASMRAIKDLGPIAGPPAAAAIKAMGAANVAIIAATGIAQASNLGGGGAAGGYSAPSSPSYEPEADVPGRQQNNAVQVIFQGPVLADDASTRQFITDVIRDAVDNRDVVVISGNSRQALEIRGA